jgi:poly(beta-D-mannuronate) lyase
MVKAGADQPGHHRIDHNFFGPKPEGSGNGYESIKMGGGDDSMFPLYTLVENNFFYRCDGETELISNKSWENIYRQNTFFECKGTLTLRWGRKCLVEGNYFIGNGVSNTGGIRITDQDHTIINNYLENITGSHAKAAISVMSGIPDTEGGDSGHGQTKNARILHNTMVGCNESLNMGYWDNDDLNDPRGEITAPENCTIANNIIFSEYGPLITEEWGPSINTTWLGNIVHGAPVGIDLDTGLIQEDPGLVKSGDGIWRVPETSPAVDRAEGEFQDVLTDFEMQPRDDGKPDIGADEWSAAERLPLPVREEDVGPDWYVASVVSTPARKVNMSIVAYPNPACDRFSISLEGLLLQKSFSVELIDLSGKKVLTRQFESPQSDPEIITEGLEGHYIVRIVTDHEVRYSNVILGR